MGMGDVRTIFAVLGGGERAVSHKQIHFLHQPHQSRVLRASGFNHMLQKKLNHSLVQPGREEGTLHRVRDSVGY